MTRRAGTGQDEPPGQVEATEHPEQVERKIPGQILYGNDPVQINQGKDAITLTVVNSADRPVQVGSHYHFAETNPALQFDRKAAWGRRLNILAGASMRFEPGAVQEIQLIPIGGQRIIAGLRGECGGKLDD